MSAKDGKSFLLCLDLFRADRRNLIDKALKLFAATVAALTSNSSEDNVEGFGPSGRPLRTAHYLQYEEHQSDARHNGCHHFQTPDSFTDNIYFFVIRSEAMQGSKMIYV